MYITMEGNIFYSNSLQKVCSVTATGFFCHSNEVLKN